MRTLAFFLIAAPALCAHDVGGELHHRKSDHLLEAIALMGVLLLIWAFVRRRRLSS